MPVEYRNRKDATSTEMTIEPATPQLSSITGNGRKSLDLVDYDSVMSISSIGLSVLALEKRTTRSQKAKQKCQQKRKTPQKLQCMHPICSRRGARKKK